MTDEKLKNDIREALRYAKDHYDYVVDIEVVFMDDTPAFRPIFDAPLTSGTGLPFLLIKTNNSYKIVLDETL